MSTSPELPVRPSAEESGPAWLTVVQAAGIGMLAGLALNALLSVATLTGQGQEPAVAPAPAECKKKDPAKDSSRPSVESTFGRWELSSDVRLPKS